MYAGWFQHRSTTELYGVAPASVAADVVRVAGPDALVQAARARLDSGQPVQALHLTDLVFAAQPDHPGARAVAADAHEALLAETENFWKKAWLTKSIRSEIHRRIEDARMNTLNFDFTGANVLVTGGTSGIGNGIAADFAQAGAAVTVTGTRRDRRLTTPRPSLGAFSYRQCQIQDPDSVDALVLAR